MSELCRSLHPSSHLLLAGEMVTSSPLLTSFWLCTHSIFCIFYIRLWREHGLAPVRGTGPSLNQSCGQNDGDHPTDSVKSRSLASCCHPVARVGTGLSCPTPAAPLPPTLWNGFLRWRRNRRGTGNRYPLPWLCHQLVP